MMFHRTKPPVTIDSREEENELGREWSRTVWPVGAGGPPPAAVPAPEPPAASAVPETDAASGEGDPPDAPHLADDELDEAALAYPEYERLRKAELAVKPEPAPAPVKRQRAPTVKPKKKSRDW